MNELPNDVFLNGVPHSVQTSELTKNAINPRNAFIDHEKNELGFTSLPVISLVMRRDLPADAKTVRPPEEDLRGTKWVLTELKYLSSPGDKKLICLSW